MKTRKQQVVIKTIHGYKVIVVPSPVNTVTVRVSVGAGFFHETEQTLGINHLLEHCIVNSWKPCDSECTFYWDKQGCVLNASTDTTVVDFFIKGLPDLTERMIQYMVDISLRPVFSDKVIRNEKKAVISELKMSMNAPDYTLLNTFHQAFYVPVGIRSLFDVPLQLKNLTTLTSAKLHETHQQLYTASNMTFVVYGEVSVSHIASLFARSLPHATSQSIPPMICYSYTPSFLHVSKKSATVMTMLGFPMKRQYLYPEMVEKWLNVLLFNELRTRHKLVYGIKSDVSTTHCSTSLIIRFECLPHVFVSVLRLLFRTLQQYTVSVDTSVLQGVRRSLKYQYLTNYPYDVYYSSHLYHPRPLYTKSQLIQQIKSFTSNQFILFMKEVLHFQHCTLVYQYPTSFHMDWSTFLKIDAHGKTHLLS